MRQYLTEQIKTEEQAKEYLKNIIDNWQSFADGHPRVIEAIKILLESAEK